MVNEDLTKLRIQRDLPSAPMGTRKKRPVLILVAIGGAIAALVLYLTGSFSSAVQVEAASVATAYPSQAFTLLNATGYVVAQRKAAVASKATGRVEWLGVAEGSRVKQGEIIARLENKDVTAAMDQAGAGVNVARANLEQGMAELRDAEAAYYRSKDLLAKGFVSRAVHDTATARYERAKAAISGFKASIGAAQANLRAARVAVDQTLIRAPFDGVVLTKSANVGDVVTPFSSALDTKGAVVTMADMSTLEVEADVSESNLSKARADQPCEIQLDALPDVRFRGVVHRIVPTVDRAKATVMVKIRFVDQDARILPEMSAKVAFLSREVPEKERNARTVVQPAAVANRNGRSVVFVIQEGRVKETPIETGTRLGDMMEVIRGVQAGDKVVLKPSDKLKDGEAVKLPAK